MWEVWSQCVCSQIAERGHKTTRATPSDSLLPMRLYLLERVYNLSEQHYSSKTQRSDRWAYEMYSHPNCDTSEVPE